MGCVGLMRARDPSVLARHARECGLCLLFRVWERVTEIDPSTSVYYQLFALD
jgi:hypothetical protein